MLAKAFAKCTEVKMPELRNFWRRATGKDDFTPLVAADPQFEA